MLLVVTIPFSTAVALDTATEAECEVIRAAFGKAVECVAGKTAIDDPTRALLQTKLGKNAPNVFLKDNSTKGANTSCLDTEFVKNIHAFMQDTYNATGHRPVITDGYRGPGAQNRAAAAGASGVRACGSPHNYGMAVDFNGGAPKDVIKWMRAYAGSTRTDQTANHNIRTIGDPLTGCGLVAANGRSFCDPNHFEFVNWRSTGGECGRCGDAPGDGTLPTPPSSPSGQGLLSNIMNMLRPQSQPFTPPSTPLQPIGAASQQVIGGAFAPPVVPVAPTTPAIISTSVPVGKPAPTGEEQLKQLAVGAPASTTSSSTTGRPLAENTIIYLAGQKVALKPPAQTQTQTIHYANQRGSESVVGFSSGQSLSFATGNAQNTFRVAYQQILNRIERALWNILRILRGEPPPQLFPEEQWTQYQ